jgi:hypothetical protein
VLRIRAESDRAVATEAIPGAGRLLLVFLDPSIGDVALSARRFPKPHDHRFSQYESRATKSWAAAKEARQADTRQ